MKRIIKYFVVLTLALVVLSACGAEDTKTSDMTAEAEKLEIVTSFTIIKDITEEIAGDKVEIHNLVPTGTDPHEYEPLPKDVRKASEADILFYNGLNLEGGKDGWFFKMIDSVGQDEENIYKLTKRVDPMYLTAKDGKAEEMNPHSFLDPEVGIKMSEDIRDVLVEVDSDNKEFYQKRAEEYLAKLKDIDQKYQEKITDIPAERRILVTSERAFQYLADHYGLKEGYIWAIDTEENGSPAQVKDLIEFTEENEVPVLFIESNVDPRPMETVAGETGIPIAEKEIYSDEIGGPEAEINSYLKYLNYNIDLIYDELK